MSRPAEATRRNPFIHSIMARSAATRLVGVAVMIAVLWLCIVWAVALP